MDARKKADIIQLWRSIFGDSEAYIARYFDAYIDDAYIDVRYDADAISAMLIAPECTAVICFDNKYMELRGRYLCGLATIPSMRKHGIMSAMIQRAELQAKIAGFQFMCLIPADDHLREYYQAMGYKSSKGLFKAYFYPDNIGNDIPATTIRKIERVNEENNEFNAMIQAIQNIEKGKDLFQIFHSRKEIIAAFADLCADGGWAVTAAPAIAWVKKVNGILTIEYWDASSSAMLQSMLYNIAKIENAKIMEVHALPSQKSILKQVCRNCRSEKYGMIKWLDAPTVNSAKWKSVISEFAMPMMMD